MERQVQPAPIFFDVRTKLLVMLALLSLPLLVMSIIQMSSYQRSLNEEAQVVTRLEAAAVAGALESWLENRAGRIGDEPLSSEAALDLYARLRRQTALVAGSVITVVDARDRHIPDPSLSRQITTHAGVSPVIEQRRWSDGVMRETISQRTVPFEWNVVVGVPLSQDTPAGRSILLLTTTWALALLASSLLAVWAVGRFTNPLRQLAASASTFGEGELQERVAVQTADEVGMLAGSFNVMASSLQARFNELRAQRAFTEEVLDTLPLGVAVLDANLTVRKANSTFAAIVGRNAESLAGRGLYEAATGLGGLSNVIEDVRRTRRAFVNYGLPLELGVHEKESGEGAKFWDVILWPTTERGGAGGDLILLVSEVTNRVRAEKLATAAFAAEKSRAAELESVINQMNEGVVIVDARGRYRVNPAAARIFDRKPGEFRDGVQALITDLELRDLKGKTLPSGDTPIGRTLERGESISGEHVLIVRGARHRGNQTEEPTEGQLTGGQAVGGQSDKRDERVLEVSATPLVGEPGKHGEGLVAVFRDITEEVRQHAEIVAAYDRLREHDRLKSAFVATVSHELRTPLNVIIGLCQLLARDRRLPLAPLQDEAVTRMERNARSLLDMVNDLLEYSRLEAGRAALHLESVNVAEVADEIVREYAGEALDKGLELRAEVLAGLTNVRTDRHKLSQVLSNLLSNAIKFTPAGTVVIAAAPIDRDQWFVEVRDTGIGMPSDAEAYIFDRFRQIDDHLTRTHGGVGLGLAITRRIVELLGGEITVKSQQGEGSCFRITWSKMALPRTGTGSLIADRDAPAVTHTPDLRARTG
ncbi:MAG: ATP-binding protein [Acidobacteriota bacterium]|nr:ATP-binding protein [Acidobacteriota bacterium]